MAALNLTEAQALTLVNTLIFELNNRTGPAQLHMDYYRGRHKLRFASSEFREYFAERYSDFADNWVPVVADSPVERLTVDGFQIAGEADADKESYRVWHANYLDADSQLGFLGSVAQARSFVLVWGNPDDETTPEVTFEDARQAIVLYEPGSRYRRRAALKTWQDGSREYATLYTASQLWKFARPLTQRPVKPAMITQAEDEIRAWQPRDTAPEPNPQPNPMGVVPMVELPNRPLLADQPISDVEPVIPLQDAVNLLWAHLFTASDFAALAQRVVIGAEAPKQPVLDSNGKKVGEKPVDLREFNLKRLFWVEDEGASINSWPAANLAVFSDVIENAIGHIAAQTRTPQHYLIGKMANLSSDALIAAETGLVKRTQEKQLWYGAALREVFRLVALAQGNDTKARACQSGRILWADAQSRNTAQLVDSLMKLKGMGFPFRYLAQRYGLTSTEVGDLMKMREEENAQDPVLAMLGTSEPHAGSQGEPPLPATSVRPGTQEPGTSAPLTPPSPDMRASANGHSRDGVS